VKQKKKKTKPFSGCVRGYSRNKGEGSKQASHYDRYRGKRVEIDSLLLSGGQTKNRLMMYNQKKRKKGKMGRKEIK